MGERNSVEIEMVMSGEEKGYEDNTEVLRTW